jgi:hypothetical protein
MDEFRLSRLCGHEVLDGVALADNHAFVLPGLRKSFLP